MEAYVMTAVFTSAEPRDKPLLWQHLAVQWLLAL